MTASQIRVHLRSFVIKSNGVSMSHFKLVHGIAKELWVSKQLHLWPDKCLGGAWVLRSMPKPAAYERWLQGLWGKISEWPT